jgi:hypothetical protein
VQECEASLPIFRVGDKAKPARIFDALEGVALGFTDFSLRMSFELKGNKMPPNTTK